MNWLQEVEANLLPLSRERRNVAKALKEWLYTGSYYDLDEPVETCQLCGHQFIRFQFQIENQHTGHDLLIGSECIKRFGISGVDDEGNVLDEEQTRIKVGRDRQKLVTDARKRRMVKALVRLASEETDPKLAGKFDINNFIEDFHERDAFTPKQLAYLLWRLKVNRIPHTKSDFKLSIKKNNYKEQLLRMPIWQIEQMQDCLSASQKTWYLKHKEARLKRGQLD